VGVDDTLGPTGRARRVAEPQGARLGDVERRVVGRGIGDEVLVGDGVGQLGVAHGVTQHDHVLELFEVGGHLLDDRQELGVDEDGASMGVAEHVTQIVGRHPHIGGVDHPAGTGDGEVRLEVTVVVPRQGGDPTSSIVAEPVERVHELLATCRELRVAQPRGGGCPTCVTGDYLGVGPVLRRIRKEHPRVERQVHHGERDLSGTSELGVELFDDLGFEARALDPFLHCRQ
jgi:hypothetical protein